MSYNHCHHHVLIFITPRGNPRCLKQSLPVTPSAHPRNSQTHNLREAKAQRPLSSSQVEVDEKEHKDPGFVPAARLPR